MPKRKNSATAAVTDLVHLVAQVRHEVPDPTLSSKERFSVRFEQYKRIESAVRSLLDEVRHSNSMDTETAKRIGAVFALTWHGTWLSEFLAPRAELWYNDDLEELPDSFWELTRQQKKPDQHPLDTIEHQIWDLDRVLQGIPVKEPDTRSLGAGQPRSGTLELAAELPENAWLTNKAAAKRLGLSSARISQLVKEGWLDGVTNKQGGACRGVTTQSLEMFETRKRLEEQERALRRQQSGYD